jgi:hypothetical protein
MHQDRTRIHQDGASMAVGLVNTGLVHYRPIHYSSAGNVDNVLEANRHGVWQVYTVVPYSSISGYKAALYSDKQACNVPNGTNPVTTRAAEELGEWIQRDNTGGNYGQGHCP